MIGDGALADLDDKGNEWDVLMVMTTSSTSGTFITAAQGRPMSKVTHDFREEHQVFKEHTSTDLFFPDLCRVLVMQEEDGRNPSHRQPEQQAISFGRHDHSKL
ncbi:uncharacterized protein LOC112346776 isoform X3 [Selaginella moellendorffii]|uniref:uncharacterized protein LOC112346776 isoform X3 n=1 Tax=Selaginella moellendorffii TaxID=88036 RepID=UPI000D1CDE62|nr:uncharacterized protein LOC112346776 isoform X3 [Selaginella moellendorffii]|eukprot:XP_024532159.1 uncharacterized protein LOC112346776 isoform X3 [Selaginella moellendorffii]